MLDDAFHYPPDLMTLLVDTIPLLCRSKKEVLIFFQGAGVPDQLLKDLSDQIARDKDSVKKYEIARQVLTRLNVEGDALLRPRREVIKRVAEFESFSSCWESDRLKAMGLVAEVRKVVNVKDSFTRLNIEREIERQQRKAEQASKLADLARRRQEIESIRVDLNALFSDTDPQRRGKKLEGVLNRLFRHWGILIRESFTICGSENEGVIEQIDGAVEFDGHLYLVEMKWWNEDLGVAEVSPHLVRVYGREGARGILISASGYTSPAIETCRGALSQRVVALCTLRELVELLEQEADLGAMLKAKVRAAIIDKNPFHPWSPRSS